MSFEADLRAYLIAQEAIAAIVGARVYFRSAPSNATMPRITYRIVAGRSEHTQGGKAGLDMARVQIDCWTAIDLQLPSLSQSVIAAVDDLRGTQGETHFRDAMLVGAVDVPEPPKSAQDVEIFHRAIDFEIWFAVPKTAPRAF